VVSTHLIGPGEELQRLAIIWFAATSKSIAYKGKREPVSRPDRNSSETVSG
jgi:hypothetical protein